MLKYLPDADVREGREEEDGHTAAQGTEPHSQNTVPDGGSSSARGEEEDGDKAAEGTEKRATPDDAGDGAHGVEEDGAKSAGGAEKRATPDDAGDGARGVEEEDGKEEVVEKAAEGQEMHSGVPDAAACCSGKRGGEEDGTGVEEIQFDSGESGGGDEVRREAVTRVAARAGGAGSPSRGGTIDEISLAEESVELDVSDGWPRLLTQTEIEQIYAVPGNKQCADCVRAALGPDGNEARPAWASTNLLVTLSPQAAGVHRSMGAHVSKVLSLTLDEWTKDGFLRMLTGGNQEVNKMLECHEASAALKPDLQREGDPSLEAYIRSKYVAHSFSEGGSGQLVQVEKRALCAVAATEYAGILFVRIVKAEGLPSMDVGSESDPYVVVKLRGGHQTMRTTTKQDCNNPVWNETLSLNFRALASDTVDFQVWDADVISKDDLIGRCEFALSELVDAQTPPDTPLAHTCIVDDGLQDYAQCGGGCRVSGCCLLPPCLYLVKPCLVRHHQATLSVEISYAPLS